MKIARVARHLVTSRARVRRAFPKRSLIAIEQAIAASEEAHAGQICFAVESALDGLPLFRDQPVRARALDVFAHLRVWDTAHNGGVLIYLLLADRAVEIVADRGIAAKVDQTVWETVCRAMQAEFTQGRFEDGVLHGIAAITRELAKHFPHTADTSNDLPDRPVLL